MVSDSIANASIPFPHNAKDFGKKKRANRSAKLKQYKLDARREQWLSQVKNKGMKEDWSGDNMMKCNGRDLDDMRRKKEAEPNESAHNNCDLELSPSNSPINTNSMLGNNDSGSSYSGSSSSGSSSGSSAGCCSGTISEEEVDGGGDDGCLDDWEAMADALAASDKREKTPEEDLPRAEEPPPNLGSSRELTSNSVLGGGRMNTGCRRTTQRSASMNSRAWSPDDEFRPQSLPNLSKHQYFSNPERHCGGGGMPWAAKSVFSAPTSCPICCEDLDLTDSSFLPCLCGFRMCLFCYKRILEEDGRCPGCRKPYECDSGEVGVSVQRGGLTIQLTRSQSMSTRA